MKIKNYEQLKEQIQKSKDKYYEELEAKKEISKLINPTENDKFLKSVIATKEIYNLLQQLYDDDPALKRIIKEKIKKIGTYIDLHKPNGDSYMIEIEIEPWNWISINETLDYSQEWSYEAPFGLENQKERDKRHSKQYRPLR